jgi:hypothetical protein
MSYLGGNELIYNNDLKEGIHSGGFSVNSLMMREGLSPIMTLNTTSLSGGSEKVSDLFSNLVVPNWAFVYGKNTGGSHLNKDNSYNKKNTNETDSDSEDEIVDDEIHDKLLELVKEHDIKAKRKNEKRTKKYMAKGLKTTTRKRKIKV